MSETYHVYTDGACSNNGRPGDSPGGWAVGVSFQGEETFHSGGEYNTTNNRMELQAAIEGISRTPAGSDVILYSDSAYLINCFKDKWYVKWIRNNWMRGKEPVANVDLWKKLIDLSQSHNIIWEKVKGHANDRMNNLCDKLAVEAVNNFRR